MDGNGQRTRDNILAEELYHGLTSRGLRVFFSNISLEQHGVAAYKKAIDDALDRTRVLVAVGTSEPNLNSQWVRYEWDSFFNDILAGMKPEGKVFAYTENVKTRELPRALRQTQCIEHEPGAVNRLYNFIVNSSAPARGLISGNVSSPAPAGMVPSRPLTEGDFHIAVSGNITATTQKNEWTAFCYQLGSILAEKHYGVYGTRAPTVGLAFHRGAHDYLACLPNWEALQTCRLMPALHDTPELCQSIRKNFLKDVHLGVFVGGGHSTKEEYEILQSRGGFALPIGASGGSAQQIWSRLREKYRAELSPELFDAYEAIGDPSRIQDEIMAAVMALIDDQFAVFKTGGQSR